MKNRKTTTADDLSGNAVDEGVLRAIRSLNASRLNKLARAIARGGSSQPEALASQIARLSQAELVSLAEAMCPERDVSQCP